MPIELLSCAAVPLAALGLRLYAGGHRDRERRRFLRAVATLPAGSRVDERRPDGTRLVIAVGRR